MAGKRFLFLFCRPPDASERVRELLEQAMTAAAFDQPVSLLLLDDAVLHLRREPPPGQSQTAPLSLLFQALELYDIRSIWVERESLAERGLQPADLVLPVGTLVRGEVPALLAAHDLVVSG